MHLHINMTICRPTLNSDLRRIRLALDFHNYCLGRGASALLELEFTVVLAVVSCEISKFYSSLSMCHKKLTNPWPFCLSVYNPKTLRSFLILFPVFPACTAAAAAVLTWVHSELLV